MPQASPITDSQLGLLLQLCAGPYCTPPDANDPDFEMLACLGFVIIRQGTAALTTEGLAYLRALLDIRSGPVRRHIRSSVLH
jgi:hypothetical protein